MSLGKFRGLDCETPPPRSVFGPASGLPPGASMRLVRYRRGSGAGNVAARTPRSRMAGIRDRGRRFGRRRSDLASKPSGLSASSCRASGTASTTLPHQHRAGAASRHEVGRGHDRSRVPVACLVHGPSLVGARRSVTRPGSSGTPVRGKPSSPTPNPDARHPQDERRRLGMRKAPGRVDLEPWTIYFWGCSGRGIQRPASRQLALTPWSA